MKICEVCGAEEQFPGEEENDEILLGLCDQCMNDFKQGLETD
ncbi:MULTISPECIES: hypothetical protein [unclassified Thermoactinomyces]|jgi:hypothetical protein|nr:MULTISPECIES: hypothetical protein [unclassified Thermoactinomyces]